MQAFTPQDDDNKAALVSKDLFDELLDCWKRCNPDRNVEVEWGGAHRGTVTYYEPTIFELDPHPDPLTVGQD